MVSPPPSLAAPLPGIENITLSLCSGVFSRNGFYETSATSLSSWARSRGEEPWCAEEEPCRGSFRSPRNRGNRPTARRVRTAPPTLRIFAGDVHRARQPRQSGIPRRAKVLPARWSATTKKRLPEHTPCRNPRAGQNASAGNAVVQDERDSDRSLKSVPAWLEHHVSRTLPRR